MNSPFSPRVTTPLISALAGSRSRAMMSSTTANAPTTPTQKFDKIVSESNQITPPASCNSRDPLLDEKSSSHPLPSLDAPTTSDGGNKSCTTELPHLDHLADEMDDLTTTSSAVPYGQVPLLYPHPDFPSTPPGVCDPQKPLQFYPHATSPSGKEIAYPPPPPPPRFESSQDHMMSPMFNHFLGDDWIASSMEDLDFPPPTFREASMWENVCQFTLGNADLTLEALKTLLVGSYLERAAELIEPQFQNFLETFSPDRRVVWQNYVFANVSDNRKAMFSRFVMHFAHNGTESELELMRQFLVRLDPKLTTLLEDQQTMEKRFSDFFKDDN